MEMQQHTAGLCSAIEENKQVIFKKMDATAAHQAEQNTANSNSKTKLVFVKFSREVK